MIIFYPSLTQQPTGQLHKFIGDTIKSEFLVDPSTAEAVLGAVGIRRDVYERAQSGEEYKTLMSNDISKLKSYLSGPGVTDNRFKEEVRNLVSKRFQTAVINGISKQQWQKFVLKADDLNEYEQMKANIENFKTGALLSTYTFDDENMAVIVEAFNTVMTLDKQLDDGSVRVANMKGKEGKPMNYSENNLYGSIESNSNWIASDIFKWMKDSGFTSEQMITERKFEMGAKPPREDARPSFKEGQQYAIELLKKEEEMHDRAAEALREIGILEPTEDESQDTGVVDSPIVDVIPTKEQVISEPAPISQAEEQENNSIDINTIIENGIQKSVEDKMKSETALILVARDLFPEYINKFEKFLPNSTSFEMAKRKVWDEFKDLRQNPNGNVIEKHLTDFTLQRMFILNKMTSEIQKESASFRQSNSTLRSELDRANSEKIRLQSDASNLAHDLNVEKGITEELTQKLSENENTIDGFVKDIEEIGVLVTQLSAERDELVVHRDENEKLKADLDAKNSLVAALNGSIENMTRGQEQLSETLNRMEKESEAINHQNTALREEKESLLSQVKTLQSQLETMTMASQKEAEPEQHPVTQKEQPRVVVDEPTAPSSPTAEDASQEVAADISKMPVSEANEVLADKIEKTKSAVLGMPNIKIRPKFDRSQLKSATASLNRLNDNLSKPDKK